MRFYCESFIILFIYFFDIDEISALNDTIKVYLKQNNRSVAMKYLKKVVKY